MKLVKNGESGHFINKKFVGHSPECPKLESSSLIINKKARYISSNYMEKIEGCKNVKDRKEALKGVGMTVSPSSIKRVQKFKIPFLLPG